MTALIIALVAAVVGVLIVVVVGQRRRLLGGSYASRARNYLIGKWAGGGSNSEPAD